MGEAVLPCGVFGGGGAAAGDAQMFDRQAGFARGCDADILPADVAAMERHDAGDGGGGGAAARRAVLDVEAARRAEGETEDCCAHSSLPQLQGAYSGAIRGALEGSCCGKLMTARL